MSQRRSGRPFAEQAKMLIQTGGQGLHRQRSRTGRCQLDGERQTVELSTHLRDLRGIVDRQVRRTTRPPGPIHEETDRVVIHRIGHCGSVARHGQSRDRVCDLTGYSQCRSTGGEDPQLRATLQEALRNTGNRVSEMLAVVEHDQGAITRQRSRHITERIVARQPKPDDPGDLARDEPAFA